MATTTAYYCEVDTSRFFDDIFKFCTECATFEDGDFAEIFCTECGFKLEYVTVPHSIKKWLHANFPAPKKIEPVIEDDLFDVLPPVLTRQTAVCDSDMPPLRFIDEDDDDYSVPEEEYEDMPDTEQWVDYWDYPETTVENPMITFMEIVTAKQSVLPPCSCPECCDDAMDDAMEDFNGGNDWDIDYPMEAEAEDTEEVPDKWMGSDYGEDYEECDSVS
jgi:hypothetical protein